MMTKYALFFFILIGLKTNIKAQQNISNSGFIYLHTDRETYAGGDEVWYSAYLVNSINKNASLKFNLYVELISSQNRLINRQVIELKNGLGNGDIKLADSIKQGKYWLRAYISPNQNYLGYKLFEKQLAVLSLFENTATSPISTTQINKPIIQFFPEGGKLINGISSNIAYKISHVKKLTGLIVNNQADTIASITTDSTGMGSFMFLPITGNQYWFKGFDENKKSVLVQLPIASEKGISFFIKDSSTQLNVFASCDEKTAQENLNKTLILNIKHHGTIVSSNEILLKSNQFLLKIDKQLLLPGINQIALFNQQGITQCIRLVYVYPGQEANLKIQNIQSNDNVSVNIKLQDLVGQPLKGSFSLSIIDGSLFKEEAADIQSEILLQSSIRDRIENIKNYFDPLNINRYKQMDLLMLTQNISDFELTSTDVFMPDTHFSIKEGINVSGSVIDERKHIPIKKANVTVRIPEAEGVKIFSGQTDSLGRFNLPNLTLYGLHNIIVTSKNSKGEQLGAIILDSIFNDTLAINYGQSKLENQLYHLDHKDSLLVVRKRKALSDGIKLKTVEITGKRKISLFNGTVIDGGYPSENFKIVRNDLSFENIRHYLLTKSKYAQPEYSRTIFVCNGEHDGCRHDPIKQRYRGYCPCDPLTPLEEVFTEDKGRVMFISDGLQVMPKVFVNQREVLWDEIKEEDIAANIYNEYLDMKLDQFESIEIKKMIFFNSNRPQSPEPGYLLYLNTKEGVILNLKSERLIATLDTYHKTKIFEDVIRIVKSNKDFLPTIYWEPKIKFDEDGLANFNLNMSKSTPKFLIRVEGITEDGNLVSATAVFSLKR